MFLVITIVFWLSAVLIVHTYVFFPTLLKWLSRNKLNNKNCFGQNDNNLPTISILLAVYNEESVIEEKIVSTFDTDYPLHKIQFLIGSDWSTDNTEKIIRNYQEKFPQIELVVFEGRKGKSEIINELSDLARGEILLLTDANVFFDEHTIFQLVKHYKNEKIGQVGGNILNVLHKKEGISYQEKSYLQRENLMKYQEGIIWGSMIGAFGGCYSIRKKLFVKVPPTFLMDDFFISMNVLSNKFFAINELEAKCFEDVSNKITEEFRRKVRISAGNFQNLTYYKHLLWPPFSGVAFSFLSHKVIRWYTPFLIIILIFSNLILIGYSNFYLLSMFLILLSITVPLMDYALKYFHIHLKLFRFITHFYLMNLALLKGFIQYQKGVNTNVWKPTQRNQ